MIIHQIFSFIVAVPIFLIVVHAGSAATEENEGISSNNFDEKTSRDSEMTTSSKMPPGTETTSSGMGDTLPSGSETTSLDQDHEFLPPGSTTTSSNIGEVLPPDPQTTPASTDEISPTDSETTSSDMDDVLPSGSETTSLDQDHEFLPPGSTTTSSNIGEVVPPDPQTTPASTDEISPTDSETTSSDLDDALPPDSKATSSDMDEVLPTDTRTTASDMVEVFLPLDPKNMSEVEKLWLPHFETMPLGKFSSYPEAVYSLLNAYYNQTGEPGDIDTSDIEVDYNKYLLPFIKKINISEDEYLNKTESFHIYSATLHHYALPHYSLRTEFLFPKIKNYAVNYIEFEPISHDLFHYANGTIINAEIRMFLGPQPNESRQWALVQGLDVVKYHVKIFEPITNDTVSKHDVWLPPEGSKWVSFTSRELVNLVKRWHHDGPYDKNGKHQSWNLKIAGLPTYPIYAYLNVVLDQSAQKSCHSTYLDRNPLCEQFNEDEQCEELLRPAGGRCCKRNIPFDSEEINVPGLNIRALTEHFYAPAALNYTYCQMKNSNEGEGECVRHRRKNNAVLTPDWNDPEKLIETDNFTIIGCKCKGC